MVRVLAATAMLVTAAAMVPTAVPAAAEVVKATPAGFESRHTVTIAAPPARVWAVLLKPSLWWSKQHTYSGDAANLSFDPRAGGCWCETLRDGGAIEHMRVAYLQPGAALRMIGGLGPLQAEGIQGAMTITLKAEGAGTLVMVDYVVGGYIRAGAETFAPGVDMVLGQQVQGLKAAAEKR